MSRLIRSRITFANVISLIALSLSLGGVSYAAATLPKGSVGAQQLKKNAVTGKKLAPRSIKRWALADNVRAALRKRARQGPRGVRGHRGFRGHQGPRGGPGPQGPAGPGAGLIRFSGESSDQPGEPQTAFDKGGIEMKVACQQDGDTTRMLIFAEPGQDTLFQINVNDDQGEDPNEPQEFESNNFQIPLTGGAAQQLGGPEAEDGRYSRSIVTAIFSGESGVVTANLSVFVDGTEDACSMQGTAIAAS